MNTPLMWIFRLAHSWVTESVSLACHVCWILGLCLYIKKNIYIFFHVRFFSPWSHLGMSRSNLPGAIFTGTSPMKVSSTWETSCTFHLRLFLPLCAARCVLRLQGPGPRVRPLVGLPFSHCWAVYYTSTVVAGTVLKIKFPSQHSNVNLVLLFLVRPLLQ